MQILHVFLQVFSQPLSQSSNQPVQNRLSLKNLIGAMIHTRVSRRKTAILANALLQDLGLITSEDFSLVIDKGKIARELDSHRETILAEQHHESNVGAVYFDGRKDKTWTNEKKGSKFYKREIREEHVTIVQEPDGTYLGHVTPTSDDAIDLMIAIRDFLVQSNFDLSNLGTTFIITLKY